MGQKGKNKGSEQYGALCYRMRAEGCEILLITTRRTGRWSIPKGWPIKGKTPEQTAEIEAFEEAGVLGEITGECLGFFTHKKNMGGEEYKSCTIGVYPLRVTRQSESFPEQGQRRYAWLCAEAAIGHINAPELSEIIRTFARTMGE